MQRHNNVAHPVNNIIVPDQDMIYHDAVYRSVVSTAESDVMFYGMLSKKERAFL